MKRIFLSYILMILCVAAGMAQNDADTVNAADSVNVAGDVQANDSLTDVVAEPEADKKAKKTRAEKILKTIPEMYVYAVGMSAADSTVYITDIQILQNAKVNTTNGFLMGRNHLSAQFEVFLAELDQPNRMCAVMFNEKGAKLAAEYEKQKKKYQKKGFLVKVIDISEFKFIVTE